MSDLDAEFWFDIADEVRPLSDIPDELAQTTLKYLNQIESAVELAYCVPLLDGWTNTPTISEKILEARGATGFTSLQELYDVAGLGPSRFTEILRTIGQTDDRTIPELSLPTQPSDAIYSSSETELKFEYEILAGPMKGTIGQYPGSFHHAAGHGSRC